MKTTFFSLLLALTGCTVVPATRVSFNPNTHELSIRSPKDISITNLVATVNSNGTSISIGSYSSFNKADVISAVAAQNAQTLKAAADIGGQILEAAVKGAK